MEPDDYLKTVQSGWWLPQLTSLRSSSMLALARHLLALCGLLACLLGAVRGRLCAAGRLCLSGLGLPNWSGLSAQALELIESCEG